MAQIDYLLKALPDKGRIVYEYNPLFNYRCSTDRKHPYNGSDIIKDAPTDLITINNKGLKFDLNHPVDIQCLESYDGSVNLIINDNKNIPRLINSRFSTLQNNTYEVVTREGNNATNLYDENEFDSDTSLYKRINKIPKVKLTDINNSGNLLVGNYVIYFKYSDADDNETDFIAESGIISCFIGTNRVPSTINGGYKDLNSLKAITLKLTNLDRQYDYLTVYYSRASSDIDQNIYKTAHKINQRFPINGAQVTITITGNEEKTDIPLSELNVKYFLADSVKTLAECLNRLFFGNMTSPTPNHKELKDLSLRIIPFYALYNASSLIGKVSMNYRDTSTAKNKYRYYNAFNIYNSVGYWPEEIYRFGIVYIMRDGTLSPVYNVLGVKSLKTSSSYDGIATINTFKDKDASSGERKYLTIDEENYSINDNLDFNAKGVCKFPDNIYYDSGEEQVISIKFSISEELHAEISKYASGFFFVRQRRIPTILAQGWTLAMDEEASVPLIPYEGKQYIERFLNDRRLLTNDYASRLYPLKLTRKKIRIFRSFYIERTVYNTEKCLVSSSKFALICPEYELNLAYFNQLFTGSEFPMKIIGKLSTGSFSKTASSSRLYGVDAILAVTGQSPNTYGIAAIPDAAPVVIYNNCKFRAYLGEAEDATKFRYIGFEQRESEAHNLVRGIFGPYLGCTGRMEPGQLVNIYIPDYNPGKVLYYFKERYEDNSEYLAISDRFEFSEPGSKGDIECFRGDCFLCNFTHRLNRNFADPSAPSNDIILDPKTWSNNYDIDDPEKTGEINRGDVNAVKLGSWITVPVRATRNISLRATDLSYPTEEGMFGHPRGFYPLHDISADGESKIAESNVLGGGFGVTVGERWNYTLPASPYFKNVYLTRIAYSDIAIGDAFKNGYRVFNAVNYRDYPRTYGGIVKLLEYQGNLVCVFEHGIALIPVNERVVSGEGAGGDVFINTNNVLPLNPRIISDTFGSQWPESVIKTTNYIYGIDTVAKKIWRTEGTSILCISDFKIQRFLNENITLGEFEMTPIIGVRNVKTHYNAFKQDVMFTFYDHTKGIHEKAWNLCWNEVLEKFITYYSWIPSYSENINNIFFSFDRDTSKFYAKLAQSNTNGPEGDGITLSSINCSSPSFSTTLNLTNRYVPEGISGITVNYNFKLERDSNNYYKLFTITDSTLRFSGSSDDYSALPNIFYLNVSCTPRVSSTSGTPPAFIDYWNSQPFDFGLYSSTIALIKDSNQGYTTAFWRHGLAGLFDKAEKIKPTFWYGKQHPFEFEVIVADKPSMHKIFDNLRIMSNKAAPESFHYEVVGEAYAWNWDKKNMYFRQEATKCLYLTLGSDIEYNWKYLLEYNLDENSEYAPQLKLMDLLDASTGNTIQIPVKSTILPLNYFRLDKLEEIYHVYSSVPDCYILEISPTPDPSATGTLGSSKRREYKFVLNPLANTVYDAWKTYNLGGIGLSRDYEHLAGAEITYDNLLNEYKVWNHVKALDIKDPKYGRLRGNMNYLEDMWDILINPIIFVEKNEKPWYNNIPPIAIVGPLPNDIITTTIVDESKNGDAVVAGTLTDTDISKYTTANIDNSTWGKRKETKIRDKYLRVRVRYSGKDLAVINSLITHYTISYA